MVIAHERALARKERDKAIAPLEREIVELHAKIDTLTTIVAGGKTKSGEVIDLPDWRKRSDAA